MIFWECLCIDFCVKISHFCTLWIIGDRIRMRMKFVTAVVFYHLTAVLFTACCGNVYMFIFRMSIVWKVFHMELNCFTPVVENKNTVRNYRRCFCGGSVENCTPHLCSVDRLIRMMLSMPSFYTLNCSFFINSARGYFYGRLLDPLTEFLLVRPEGLKPPSYP